MPVWKRKPASFLKATLCVCIHWGWLVCHWVYMYMLVGLIWWLPNKHVIALSKVNYPPFTDMLHTRTASACQERWQLDSVLWHRRAAVNAHSHVGLLVAISPVHLVFCTTKLIWWWAIIPKCHKGFCLNWQNKNKKKQANELFEYI